MAPRVSKSRLMLCDSPDSQTAAGSEAAETPQGKPPDKRTQLHTATSLGTPSSRGHPKAVTPFSPGCGRHGIKKYPNLPCKEKNSHFRQDFLCLRCPYPGLGSQEPQLPISDYFLRTGGV